MGNRMGKSLSIKIFLILVLVFVLPIQALVGHAEIDMTMYYAHAQESFKQDPISRYDEAFSAPGGGLYRDVLTFVKSG